MSNAFFSRNINICKLIIIVTFLGIAAVVIIKSLIYQKNYREWNKFKYDFNKSYNTSEETLRRDIFFQNLNVIKSHNSKGHSSTFKVGINQYSDFTFEEMVKMNEPIDINEFNSINVFEFEAKKFIINNVLKVPDFFDWREKGIVTRVKNQELCGSCYAFSSLAAIESQLILTQNKSFDLSTQELIDCGESYGMLHCLGGMTDGVFSYINSKNGLSLEEDYPYKATNESCKEDINRVNFSIKSFWLTENEEEMKAALFLHGPVITFFDCLHDLFIKYSSGIYYDSECSSSNEFTHAVLTVGYGSENGMDYWIVKNSWGVTWGENGYFRIARNKNFHCLIGEFGQIPILGLSH